MKIVSGKTGTPHVTSQQFRQIIEGICGQDSYILGSGENLKPELASNNILKIRSGMMCHHGNVSSVDIGTYDEVELPNGSQGMKRIVLIVNRYTKNENTGVESDDWVVISGTPAESDPVSPEYTEGNLQNGDLVDDCPVFEVHYDGINVTEVKKLLPMVPNINELNSNFEILKSDLSKNVKSTIITKTMNLVKGQNKIGNFTIPSDGTVVAITGSMKYGGAIFSLPMPMMEYSGGAYAEYGIELLYNNGSVVATSSAAWNNVTLRAIVWYIN